MKQIIMCILFVGLISYSAKSQGQKATDKEPLKEKRMEDGKVYREIVLSENRLNDIPIPFPQKDMLSTLREKLKPYRVEKSIRKRNRGGDYTYFTIVDGDGYDVAFLNFDPKNKYRLREIVLVSLHAKDQYGIRIGDYYEELIEKRKTNYKSSVRYFQSVYLYAPKSSIFYELSGNFVDSEELIVDFKKIKLTEGELSIGKVESIIWKNRWRRKGK